MKVNDYSSNEDRDLEYIQNIAVIEITPMRITLTIPAVEENNNTLVICKVIANRNYMSNISFLFVQGTVYIIK